MSNTLSLWLSSVKDHTINSKRSGDITVGVWHVFSNNVYDGIYYYLNVTIQQLPSHLCSGELFKLAGGKCP